MSDELAGIRVVVTRSSRQAAGLIERLTVRTETLSAH